MDPSKDIVEVDGSRVPLDTDLVHYLVNKPAGVVTTARDPHGRTTIVEVVDAPVRVWPVGRLDVATEGAVLVTNDGDLTQRLTHPSFGVPKTYLAEVAGSVGAEALRVLRSGVALSDGVTAPAAVIVRARERAHSLVEITIKQGRNRQVRRMFEAVGHPVERLVRTAVGPIRLGRLKPGTIRRLNADEVRALYRAAGL
jgi:23S rRNA pseudouridine2605 synthase